MDIRVREAIRYLGYGKSEPDENIKKLIDSSFQELDQVAERKFYYQKYSLKILNDKSLLLDTLEINSRNLCKNLQGCEEVLLLGATLGAGVDRLLQKYERLDIARAVVLQACAAAYLEEFCDIVVLQKFHCNLLQSYHKNQSNKSQPYPSLQNYQFHLEELQM